MSQKETAELVYLYSIETDEDYPHFGDEDTEAGHVSLLTYTGIPGGDHALVICRNGKGRGDYTTTVLIFPTADAAEQRFEEMKAPAEG